MRQLAAAALCLFGLFASTPAQAETSAHAELRAWCEVNVGGTWRDEGCHWATPAEEAKWAKDDKAEALALAKQTAKAAKAARAKAAKAVQQAKAAKAEAKQNGDRTLRAKARKAAKAAKAAKAEAKARKAEALRFSLN